MAAITVDMSEIANKIAQNSQLSHFSDIKTDSVDVINAHAQTNQFWEITNPE